MIKIRNIFVGKIRNILLILVLSLLQSGCKLILLDPKGTIAADEKHILITAVLLMLIVVVPVIILTLLFAWHYRVKNTKATYAPHFEHSTIIEVICWTIPCIIIAILGTITWTSSHKLDPYRPLASKENPITIQAIALEWRWLFIYPEQKIATIDFIEFPVNVPIRFLITAEGPMNSFQIPQLAGQIYAMAGMQSKLHLIANTPGDYPGISANFSGDGFSDMKFTARATSVEEFNQWVQTVKQSSDKLNLDVYNQLMKPNTDNNIKYFSYADNTLFDTVVMKSMMPMNNKVNHHD